MTDYDVIIIGAGASGLLAAVSACRCGKRVLVVEKNARAARKLMITGKGRCNVTNSDDIKGFMGNIYPEPRFLYPAFKSFFSSEILAMLDEAGVEVALERGGRYFPASGKAVDVVDALLATARRAGAKFLFSTNVTDIIVADGAVSGVKVKSDCGEKSLFADKVIICTGGKSYPLTGSTGDGYDFARKCGHSLSETLPALVPLVGKGDLFTKLKGLNLKNISASLWIDGKKSHEEFGELEFTDYGVSGPVILTMSRWAVIALHEKRSIHLSIDLKPALDERKLDARILRDLDANGKTKLKVLFREWLPMQMIPVFIGMARLDGEKLASQLTGDERRKIVSLMKDFAFDIVGHRDFNEAIVTSGGVPVDEINQKTMESRLVKGLFFAGEVIDVDANTGGYNLQIAFSTGWLAGMSE
ncbi:MAG: NAD(P)/FAD-dependent oxidoreductase [Bacteroidales bacterium]|nr:NAD(P)/FAD-dependent oxidoreductase [Bacteroidales bacterium]